MIGGNAGRNGELRLLVAGTARSNCFCLFDPWQLRARLDHAATPPTGIDSNHSDGKLQLRRFYFFGTCQLLNVSLDDGISMHLARALVNQRGRKRNAGQKKRIC